jgi:small subunit ribosomal protein S6
MERLYETTVILDPDLGKEDVDAEVGRLVEIIKNHAGETEITHVGRRGLEYPINNKNYGQYVLLCHGGDQAVVADLERQILINEKLLRHLTVRKDKFAPSDAYETVEENSGRPSRGRGDQGRPDARNIAKAKPEIDSVEAAPEQVAEAQEATPAE